MFIEKKIITKNEIIIKHGKKIKKKTQFWSTKYDNKPCLEKNKVILHSTLKKGRHLLKKVRHLWIEQVIILDHILC